MDCWEVLGLDTQASRKQVKIAYAKLLKQTRPDDDPEGFQRLHKAYKSALSYAIDDAAYAESIAEPVSASESANVESYQQSESIVESGDANDNHQPVTTQVPADSNTQQQPTIISDPEGQQQSSVIAESIDAGRQNQGREPSSASEDLSNQHEEIVTTILEPPEQIQDSTSALQSDSEPPEDNALTDSAPLSPEQQALIEDIEAHEQSLSSAWEEFHQELAAVVRYPEWANKPDSWLFLETMPAMRDLEFRASASDAVFELVSEMNEVALQKKSLYIKRPVLNYLNQQLGWDKKWQHFENHYTRSSLNAVFPYLAEADSKPTTTRIKREIYYYRRALAFGIDLLLLIAAILVVVLAHNAAFEQERDAITVIVFTLIYFAVIIPLQESSVYQATLGKRLLKLRVIDSRGDRLSFIQASWRSVVTLCCCIGFRIIVWLNIILSWWRSELVQDSVSRSYVIRR